jgi:DNA-binding MarR family transcriptional regulator
MPGLDRPRFDFAKRVGRLGRLQDEALSRCLAAWNLVIADHNVLSLPRTVGVPYELRPTDLRKRLVLTSAAIANTVKRLEQMRLVERIPDPVDKRSSWVRLTRDGIKVTEETIRAWNTVQEKMFADVDPQLAQQASTFSARSCWPQATTNQPPQSLGGAVTHLATRARGAC